MIDNNQILDDKNSPGPQIWALIIAGLLATVTCVLFIAAFMWFGPDQLSLAAKYFPSPTPTKTPTPTPSPAFEPVTVVPYEDYSPDYPYYLIW